MRWIKALMVGVIFAASYGVPADAGCECWTRSANDGAVDEGATSRAIFRDPGLDVSDGTFPFTLNVRYNIESLPFFFSQSFATHDLTVTYRDNGPNAQVQVRIMEVSNLTGVTTEKVAMRFNSNSFPAAAGIQRQTVVVGCPNSFGFDFDNNYYYALVRLTRSTVVGQATLIGLKIDNASVNCG